MSWKHCVVNQKLLTLFLRARGRLACGRLTPSPMEKGTLRAIRNGIRYFELFSMIENEAP
jgi:hypothetical protein